MRHKIYPAARRRIIEIWQYTDKTWVRNSYKHHYIFFRELSKDLLGIVNVLHVNMDIPSRLKENLDE